MATARKEHDWSVASSHMAVLANIHRAKNTAPIHPNRFNPYAPRTRPTGGIQKALFDIVGLPG